MRICKDRCENVDSATRQWLWQSDELLLKTNVSALSMFSLPKETTSSLEGFLSSCAGLNDINQYGIDSLVCDLC